jgi:hypothetical protein
MISEHYIILALWILGGDMTVSSLKALQFPKRKHDFVDEIIYISILIVWPAVVLWGILTRRWR